MRRLASLVAGHPWPVVLAWAVGVAAITLWGPAFGAAPHSSLGLPAGTESARANALERAHFGAGSVPTATGGVITSCGLVMASAFLLLLRSPLVLAEQIGLVVVLGVLPDTFLVRPVLVPALATLLRTEARPVAAYDRAL